MSAEQKGGNSHPEYHATVRRVGRRLRPGLIVPDDLGITVIGHQSLRPQAFSLRDIDRQPVGIGHVWYPGRSAQVTFSLEAGVVCRKVFGRAPRSTDRLYEVSPLDLEGVGYAPVSTPLRGHRLHVNLVYAG